MNPPADLFGNEESTTERRTTTRKPSRLRGYAAPPGSGPKGEKCGTCVFKERFIYSKACYKCYAARNKWSRSAGTDIRLKTPACSFWRAIPAALINAQKLLEKMNYDESYSAQRTKDQRAKCVRLLAEARA